MFHSQPVLLWLHRSKRVLSVLAYWKWKTHLWVSYTRPSSPSVCLSFLIVASIQIELEGWFFNSSGYKYHWLHCFRAPIRFKPLLPYFCSPDYFSVVKLLCAVVRIGENSGSDYCELQKREVHASLSCAHRHFLCFFFFFLQTLQKRLWTVTFVLICLICTPQWLNFRNMENRKQHHLAWIASQKTPRRRMHGQLG